MRLHAYASQPNYWRHLAPIVDELRARGYVVSTWSKRASQPWGARIRPLPAEPVLVASEVDARECGARGLIYVEHGAGQTYIGHNIDGRGYAGGPGLDHVHLFIAPGEHVADRWRARYPNANIATVGCPALDVHFRAEVRGSSPLTLRGVAQTGRADGGDRSTPGRSVDNLRGKSSAPTSVGASVVAITGHWRCGTCTETMPATPMFERGIRELVDAGVRVIGHAHPRDGDGIRAMWDRLGVPFEVDPDVILASASLLVADNTSLMYEAAAVGVPVLALNSPRWRRDVEHGLRFWSYVPGLQVDRVSDFMNAVMLALDDPPEARALRKRAARHVYARRDGTSAAGAADAIEQAMT